MSTRQSLIYACSHIGAVTQEEALIWFRVSDEFNCQIEYSVGAILRNSTVSPPVGALKAFNYTATVKFSGLEPGTVYY